MAAHATGCTDCGEAARREYWSVNTCQSGCPAAVAHRQGCRRRGVVSWPPCTAGSCATLAGLLPRHCYRNHCSPTYALSSRFCNQVTLAPPLRVVPTHDPPPHPAPPHAPAWSTQACRPPAVRLQGTAQRGLRRGPADNTSRGLHIGQRAAYGGHSRLRHPPLDTASPRTARERLQKARRCQASRGKGSR